MERHLVTGGTGFVGGALVLELVARTDVEIICLVRAKDERLSPEERFATAIARAARAYGQQSLLPQVMSRCRVIAGDVTKPGCGVVGRDAPRVDQVWHSAASLAFEDAKEEEILRQNVAGTEAVVQLAGEIGAHTFNHFSTAYVAGSRTGTIEETLPAEDADANNAYERSKIRGEYVAIHAPVDRIRIFRPSIVVGHSQTFAATTFTGLYGFVRNLMMLREEVGETLGLFLQHRPLRLIADPAVPMNFVPVDLVARAAVAVSRSGSDARIYHLTNSEAVSVGEGMQIVARAVGIREPQYVSSRDALTSIDAEADDRLVFYGSYIRNAKLFDRSHTDAAIGSERMREPVIRDRLEEFVGWYVDHLRARRTRRAVRDTPVELAGTA